MIKLLPVAAALAVTTTVLSAGTAHAAPAVRFTAVQYDSPGDDTGTNASVNAEWFRIKNFSSTARKLGGWTVRDESGTRFTFPKGFTLKAGRSVTVHTGTGSNTRSDLYWGQSYYVWNNTGDTATLKKPSGTKADSCTWGDGTGSTAC